MSTQDKHPSHIPSAGQNNPLVYKLAKANNPREPNNYRIHYHINLQTQKLINSQTYHPNNSRYINSSTYNPINSQTQKKTPTHQRVSSQTQKLKTHQPRNPSNQKLKIIIFILQYCFDFHPVLAKI
jgi:hypothetical protein